MAIREQDTRMGPNSGSYRRAVGVFKRQEDVEHVIRSLKDHNFDMDRVSLLARNVDAIERSDDLQEAHGNEAREGAGIGATTGTVLGGVTGFLIGVGLLAIPGVGPVLAAGAEISALGSTLAGAGAGALAGGIVGALVGLGIPEERAKEYENRVKAGDYLLMVSGSEDEVRRAESFMRERNVEEFEIFGAQRTAQTTEHTTVQRETVTPAREPQGRVINTYDIDNDNEPEIIEVDKRQQPR